IPRTATRGWRPGIPIRSCSREAATPASSPGSTSRSSSRKTEARGGSSPPRASLKNVCLGHVRELDHRLAFETAPGADAANLLIDRLLLALRQRGDVRDRADTLDDTRGIRRQRPGPRVLSGYVETRRRQSPLPAAVPRVRSASTQRGEKRVEIALPCD